MSMLPDNIRGEWERAKEVETKYSTPTHDPMFFRCTDDLMWLIKKYGRRVIRMVLDDYKIRRK